MTTEDRKQLAVEFLRRAREGNRAAAEQLVAPGARHHNPYFAAGMPTLLDAIAAAAKESPGAEFAVQRVVAEDEYVVVHSHVRHRPGTAGIAVVHIFRFDGDRIAELWDVGQPVPEHNPNTDGMF
jgi:predicted SnoaL-like aldol condensation-catalyzing enzyme